jgi:hypothetical protein
VPIGKNWRLRLEQRLTQVTLTVTGAIDVTVYRAESLGGVECES